MSSRDPKHRSRKSQSDTEGSVERSAKDIKYTRFAQLFSHEIFIVKGLLLCVKVNDELAILIADRVSKRNGRTGYWKGRSKFIYVGIDPFQLVVPLSSTDEVLNVV